MLASESKTMSCFDSPHMLSKLRPRSVTRNESVHWPLGGSRWLLWDDPEEDEISSRKLISKNRN